MTYEFKCPICKIKCRKHCWNYNCLKEIGRDIEWKLIDNIWTLCDYGSEIPHRCLKGQFIKNGVQYKPLLNDKTRKELYLPLSPWEIRQIEYGRVEYQKLFENDEFYRSRHIESKIIPKIKNS